MLKEPKVRPLLWIYLIVLTIQSCLSLLNATILLNRGVTGSSGRTDADVNMVKVEDKAIEVEDKFITVFGSRAEDLSRLFFYLEQHVYNVHDDQDHPVIRVLHNLIPNTEAFVAHGERLIADTKIAENNVAYYRTITEMHRRMLNPDETPFDGPEWQGLQIVATRSSMQQTSALSTLARAFDRMPARTKQEMLDMAKSMVSNK